MATKTRFIRQNTSIVFLKMASKKINVSSSARAVKSSLRIQATAYKPFFFLVLYVYLENLEIKSRVYLLSEE